MANYYVSRTLGGGYRVTDDAVEHYSNQAARTAGSALGAVLDCGLNAAIGFRQDSVERRRARELRDSVDELQRAAETRDWGRAYLLATDFVRLHPDESYGYGVLAEAASNLGHTDEALDIVGRMEDLGLANHTDTAALRLVAYLAREDMRGAFREAQVLIDAPVPAARRFGLLVRAKVMLWLGDLDQSLRDADAVTAAEPSETAYELRGDVHWARGELDAARADYSFAHRLAPSPLLEGKIAAVSALLGQHDVDSAAQSAVRQAPRQDRRGTEQTWTVAAGTPPASALTARGATVLVRRVRQKNSSIVKYKLYVDSQQVGTLATGETRSLQLTAGVHTVRVGCGLIETKSKVLELMLVDGEEVQLECGMTTAMLSKLVVRRPGPGNKPFEP